MPNLREPLQIFKGLASRIPATRRSVRGGGFPSASYSYSVWIKHLWHLDRNGLKKAPDTVVELGPGQSLGVGLAALLSGANAYYALDSTRICDWRTSAKLLDEMVLLFRRRTGQHTQGWPAYGPEFPNQILPETLIDVALSAARIAEIARAFCDDSTITVRYIAPWTDRSIFPGSADVVLSHSAMQYVAEITNAYRAMYNWLRPGGMISHQIDFSGMQFAGKAWNDHWSREERIWRIIVGNRPGAINRLPFSAHVSAIQAAGFEVLCAETRTDPYGIRREALARRWAELSDSDLHARGGFIQARKPSSLGS